jgi:hypothetical protein
MFFSLAGFSQEKETLKPAEISKLVPSRIKGFSIKGESKSTILSIGTLRYSLCERVFTSRDKMIKILLFDYVQAPIMYTQSLKKWERMNEIMSDSITFKKQVSEGQVSYESDHRQSKRAQISYGINNRFYLALEAENLTLPELREFFRNFDLAKFPE